MVRLTQFSLLPGEALARPSLLKPVPPPGERRWVLSLSAVVSSGRMALRSAGRRQDSGAVPVQRALEWRGEGRVERGERRKAGVKLVRIAPAMSGMESGEAAPGKRVQSKVEAWMQRAPETAEREGLA